jgi:UDP-GlcNAc:undecaprenyl-phosphate GlcNAc-1-phosphate transferase
MTNYFFYFLVACGLSIIFTPLIKRLATKKQILDFPSSSRKIHSQPIPLLGGVGIYLAFLVAVLLYLWLGKPDFHVVPLKFFLAILSGGLILIIGGALDDKYDLPPKISWLFPALASLIIVCLGIGVGITKLTNPFGNQIDIGFKLFALPFSFYLMWLWMMGMVYTTKFLDGLDGLAAGIAFIGGATLFALSLTAKINQPITATLAAIFCGSLLGYLFFAFFPAKIFLGEGGSTFVGFTLGVLAIILGAKIATALLVMGIPILDVAWVIVRRLWYKNSPFKADRQHLHFRLLDIGFSQRQAVLILYGISAVFGFTAVFLQSRGKLVALILLFCLMLAMAISVVMLYKRKHPHIPDKSNNINQ